MKKEEKIQLLESILDTANFVRNTKNINNLEIMKGFTLEVFINKPCTDQNEFMFDNIHDAISTISETRKITNKTFDEMNKEIIELCEKANIDPNNIFGLRFLIS